MELRQICKKGASIEVLIYKGKRNQTRQLQRCVIHPNSLSYQGKTCPVALLEDYLALRHSLGHNGENDLIFPQVGAKWQRIKTLDFVMIRVPLVAIS